jgi:hypothetical protein
MGGRNNAEEAEMEEMEPMMKKGAQTENAATKKRTLSAGMEEDHSPPERDKWLEI